MEKVFKLPEKEFIENYKEAKEKCKNKGWISERSNKGHKITYMTWSKVWLWTKNKYPTMQYFIDEVTPNYIICSLFIEGCKLGNQILNLENFKNKETGEIINQQTHEQLVMRVFVKLVAQYLGFGLHLWSEAEIKSEYKTTSRKF